MHDSATGRRGERIGLRHQRDTPFALQLRELRGDDELALDGVDTRAAAALLERLSDHAEVGAGALSASDRDAALAALHRRLWGDRIVASLRCAACESMYDLSFELAALQRQLAAAVPSHRVVAANRIDAAGRVWQLPTADDETAAAELGATRGRAQLLSVATGGAIDGTHADVDAPSAAEAAAALEALAPILDVDLDSVCAECGHAQLARFDVQSFVLQRLLDERERLIGELHLLASAYRWSLAETLALPRSLRQALVRRAGQPTAALA